MDSAPRTLPNGVSQYYAALARSDDPTRDPIAAQFVPTAAEERLLPYESGDPIADIHYQAGRRLIHHYRNRVLLLANDRCATYCRFCFRRHFTGNSTGRITPDELTEAVDYISGHPEVSEVLISGGDPLMLPDEHLATVLQAIRSIRSDLVIRVATRVPVVLPARVTDELVAAMGTFAPLWVIIHTNHPAELTDEFRAAVGRFADNGMPLLNQTVLLRGVNAEAPTLEQLFRGLVSCRVKPYYLFQGDLASGTSHFRTTIDEGLAIMADLRMRLSGIELPTYAVDLPGGGGKVELNEATIVRREPGWYILSGVDGREYRYPDESVPLPGRSVVVQNRIASGP